MFSLKLKARGRYTSTIQESSKEENQENKFVSNTFSSGVKRESFAYKKVISAKSRNYNNKISSYLEEYYEK